MYKVFYILVFFICCQQSIAQQYNFSNVGTNKGLPSSECYGMMQDSKGYMWVRTLNGLCKFTGKKFKYFTLKEGLKSNSVYAIYEDQNGKVWFATSSSHIGYIYNDSIHYLPSSEQFAKENGYGQKVFYQIVSDKDLNIYVSSHERAYKFNAKDNYKTYDLFVQNDYYLKILEINKHPFCVPDTITKLRILQKKEFKLMVYGKKIHLFWDETTIKQGIIRITYPCSDKYGNIFFHINNRLYCIDKAGNFLERNFDALIYHVFIDKDNNLWIGLNSRGLIMFPNSDLSKEPKHLLKEETISGIIQDFEGGIWLSSLNKGLFYCKNLYNENFINNKDFNYKPEMLKIIDSTLYISNFKSEIVQYNLANHHLFSKLMNLENAQIGILDIDKTNGGYLLSGRNSLYKLDDNFNFLERVFWEKKLKLSSGAYNTIVTTKNQILGISKNYLTNYTNGYSYKLPSFGNDIIEFENNIYVATKNGLLLFNDSIQHKFKKLIADKNLIKLLVYNQNIIAICRDGSVYKLDNKHQFKRYEIGNVGLNDACIYSQSTLIMASNAGIYFLNLTTDQIKLINSNDGILDNEIFKIATYNNTAYYSTIYGIGSFAIDKIEPNEIQPKLILAAANSNENESFFASGTYPYNSSFTFKFDLISFKDDAPAKLFYKLNGYNKNWKANESGEITYTNLTNGNYSLSAYMQNSSGVKSKIITVPFTIQIPYFKTWWFLVLILGIIILLAYVIYRITYYYINKREVEKTKVNKMLAEYQLMGLKAQMNPHFIFNCLNSIQKYVLDHDSKQAYTYMAKFSKLIRFVLDISDKAFVALSDELELVKIYAELEQLRFSKKFNFVMEVEEQVKTDEIMIPSMLIQPYLENAIWHGIMNLPEDRKGEVKIEVKIVDSLLEIIITDSGVGRSKAKLLNQKSHQSKGLSINEKRIEAINYLLKSNNATVELIDLFDDQHLSAGTKVVIKLPIKYDE